MTARVRPYDIGCEPSPSVPAETVIQDGWATYLLFFAVSKAVGPSGYLDDLGVAVVECHHCVMAKFGYPNDEGLPEHPLYHCGMAEAASSILEVVDSAWAAEVDGQQVASARRIWGGRGIEPDWMKDRNSRHFIVTLKEKTFECLASSMVVERFCPTFAEAAAFVIGRPAEH
ncbi:MAG TPA: hypothetical protein VMS17_22155 [Gemmataceae bacterium]|nr:hypothetical protein [Gemmataceae bacterium]